MLGLPGQHYQEYKGRQTIADSMNVTIEIMNKPEMYSRVNDLQRRDVQKVVQNSIKLMHFKESDVIADMGCGSGDVTREILLKQIPMLKSIVAVDISKEMLKFATSQNGHPQISYAQLDISCKDSVANFRSQFDHAFSFHVFHWIMNQEQLFHNVFKLLKPGGDMLSLLILKCDLKTVFRRLMDSSKWNQYMTNVKDFVFPYQESQNPLKDLEDMVEQAGFAHIIKTEEYSYIYNSVEKFTNSMEPVMPFMENIPSERRAEFMDDLVQFAADCNFIATPITPDSKVVLPYLTAVMYLRKPYE